MRNQNLRDLGMVYTIEATTQFPGSLNYIQLLMSLKLQVVIWVDKRVALHQKLFQPTLFKEMGL